MGLQMGKPQEKHLKYLSDLRELSDDNVAVWAATNPDGVMAGVAQIELQQRVAKAQIAAANRAANAQVILSWLTFGLICVTLLGALITAHPPEWLFGPAKTCAAIPPVIVNVPQQPSALPLPCWLSAPCFTQQPRAR